MLVVEVAIAAVVDMDMEMGTVQRNPGNVEYPLPLLEKPSLQL
jgi:hypothetical protein